jgi:peptide/nickel transport system substrate-binding protein
MTPTHDHPAPGRRGRHRSRWAALAVASALALAAVASVGSSASGAQGGSDQSGVVKISSNLAALGPLHFDPATSVVNADLTWQEMIFGTLMRWDSKGGLQPWLAESVEVVDPQTVQMTLREGMTFTDGAPFDAEAVRTGLLHTKNDAVAASASSRHAGFKFLEDVVVDSPTQVTMKLNAAGASDFLESLAHREGAIVNPKQIGTGEIDTNPIGAGPFVFESYTPEQLLSVRRNEDFFDAKHFKFGGIDWVHAPTGPAAVSGLLSGAVDIAALQASDVGQVEQDSDYQVLSGTTDYQYIIMQVCPGKPPFDNEKFRKGVQLAFDRDAIVALAFQGQAEPAYDLWPEGNVNFNPAAKKLNTYNPKKAKKLIAESGVEDPSFEMHYVSALTAYGPLTEVLQSQLEEVGVETTIVPDADILNGFIQPQKAGAMVIPGSRRNVDKYNRLFQSGAQTTLCGVARDDIMDVVIPTAGMSLTDPARAAAFKKADLMAAKNANPIPLVYTVNNYGLTKDVIGGKVALNQATGGLLLDDMTVKSSS